MNFFQKRLTTNSYSSFKKFNLNLLARFFILIYQSTISYFLGGNCRYYPSCSHYASEAFEKHRLDYAFYLSLKRLMSCHPFSRKHMYDPVPLNSIEKRLYE